MRGPDATSGPGGPLAIGAGGAAGIAGWTGASAPIFEGDATEGTVARGIGGPGGLPIERGIGGPGGRACEDGGTGDVDLAG